MYLLITLFSYNKKEKYNISLLKFKNWDHEPGDFDVIKIASRVRTDFIQTDANGWDYFYTEGTTSDISKPVYTIESSVQKRHGSDTVQSSHILQH
jgi:hypothetical protein